MNLTLLIYQDHHPSPRPSPLLLVFTSFHCLSLHQPSFCTFSSQWFHFFLSFFLSSPFCSFDLNPAWYASFFFFLRLFISMFHSAFLHMFHLFSFPLSFIVSSPPCCSTLSPQCSLSSSHPSALFPIFSLQKKEVKREICSSPSFSLTAFFFSYLSFKRPRSPAQQFISGAFKWTFW